jgi:ribosomal protein S6--L-glutamate ligase
MEIAVISKKKTYFSTQEIIKAIKRTGNKPIYVNTPKIRLCIEFDRSSILYEDRLLSNINAIIPRIGRSLTTFGYMMINQFKSVGVPSTLSSKGLINGRNKFMALQILSKSGVPFPTTWLAASRMSTGTIKYRMDFPIILKLISGTQGIGVMRVSNEEDAIPIIDTLSELDQLILIQKFLPNAGEDIRAFVVDNRVVAAMKRLSPSTDWRSNIHVGGTGKEYHLTSEEEEMAIKAAEKLDIDIAGVDLIQTDTGTQLIEVNVSPGFKGLLAATGVNPADNIAEYAVKIAKK